MNLLTNAKALVGRRKADVQDAVLDVAMKVRRGEIDAPQSIVDSLVKAGVESADLAETIDRLPTLAEREEHRAKLAQLVATKGDVERKLRDANQAVAEYEQKKEQVMKDLRCEGAPLCEAARSLEHQLLRIQDAERNLRPRTR
jgi:hypothetical protein